MRPDFAKPFCCTWRSGMMAEPVDPALTQTPLCAACIARSAPAWCRSPAMRCRSSIQPASSPSISGRATNAGLFDVSHMGQSLPRQAATTWRWRPALERLVPADIAGLEPGRIRYTQLSTPRRRHHRRSDGQPASPTDDGRAHPRRQCGAQGDRLSLAQGSTCRRRSRSTVRDDRALLALQGPKAAEVMARPSRRSAAGSAS